MLLQKSYKENDIIVLKLLSGEEVIAKFTGEEDDDFIQITQPLMTVATDQGLALVPFMITVEPKSTLKIRKFQTICISKPITELIDHYIEQTTGLKLGI